MTRLAGYDYAELCRDHKCGGCTRCINELLRAYATRLEAALEKAHACPTVREDGECDGCYISEVFATWPPLCPACIASRDNRDDSGKCTCP